ncbi:hypothetical protein TcCL_NonESM07621 [Trypanosoma cruzi]|nr:hypothetical protein TcCL_NonESM07621 [Trypanosoma cruzi]
MPRSITGLGSRGHQAVSHGPQAAWRSHGGGNDCGPPVCGALQLVAGRRCNTLGLLHSVRPDTCGNVTAAPRAVPRCISNHLITAAGDVAHAKVKASRSASRRTTKTCFRRGSKPVCRGMPSSVPAVWDGRWWSDSM